MSFKEGDFYVRKIGRAILTKMMPDFPSRLWFSTDRDHTCVYDEKAVFGDVMCMGKTVLLYGARCHFSAKDSDYVAVYPRDGKGTSIVNSPSPHWLRAILYQLYDDTRHVFVDRNDTNYICSAAVRGVLTKVLAREAGESFICLDRETTERYRMPSLVWFTEFNTWFESWEKRGMPMMIRNPFDSKTARLHLQTVEGDFPEVYEYPMEVKDDIQK